MRLLIVYFVLFVSVQVNAQYSIGLSYQPRMFPLEHWLANNDGTYKEILSVDHTIELPVSIELEPKTNCLRMWFIGPSVSYSSNHFERYSNTSMYGGSYTNVYNHREQAVYVVSYFGVFTGFLFTHKLSDIFSIGSGFKLGVNRMIYQDTKDKSHTTTQTHYQSYPPNTAPYTTTTYSTNVSDLRSKDDIFRLEVPLIFRYTYPKLSFQFQLYIGCSTESRTPANHNRINTIVSPGFSVFFPVLNKGRK